MAQYPEYQSPIELGKMFSWRLFRLHEAFVKHLFLITHSVFCCHLCPKLHAIFFCLFINNRPQYRRLNLRRQCFSNLTKWPLVKACFLRITPTECTGCAFVYILCHSHKCLSPKCAYIENNFLASGTNI